MTSQYPTTAANWGKNCRWGVGAELKQEQDRFVPEGGIEHHSVKTGLHHGMG